MVITTVLLWGISCLAETRIIGVQVQKATNATIQVAISSDVKEENRVNLTVKQAQVILQNAKGWGSSVLVGVEAHGVSLGEYLPLLKAISESMWLELVFVEGRKPDFIRDNIKKRIEQMHPEVQSEGAPSD